MLLKKNKKKNLPMGNRDLKEKENINKEFPIPQYAPYANVRPVGYKKSVCLNQFQESFEKMCKDFLAQANPDDENGAYMDNQIDSAVDENLSNLKVQRADHVRLICIDLSELHMGTRIKLEATLKAYREEMDAILKELAVYTRIYNKGTAFDPDFVADEAEKREEKKRKKKAKKNVRVLDEQKAA